jgi:hypothetical protein
MKKTTIYLMLLLLSVSIIPTSTYADVSHSSSISNNPKEIPPEVQIMLDRLNEIKSIDKSEMSRVEKKALRKEVKSINKTLRSSGNGIYLSIGAILIIVLLLILLL